MPDTWQQKEDRFTWGEISAELAPDDGAFVFISFGAKPDADRVFAAIREAMRFGQLRMRLSPETKPVIDQLLADKRLKCVPAVGTEEPELGIVAIKTG